MACEFCAEISTLESDIEFLRMMLGHALIFDLRCTFFMNVMALTGIKVW